MDKSEFMEEAIALAGKKFREGEGGPFGAVVVKDGRIVGRGWNRVLATNDPTAHAEITAIREACYELNTYDLSGCEIYSSCEPCPMCLAAIMWARVDKLYYAADRDDAARAGFDDKYFYEQACLPPDGRDLASEQVLREKAVEVFSDWIALPDKIIY